MVMTRSAYRRWQEEQHQVPDLADLLPSQESSLSFLSQQSEAAQPTIHQAYRASDTAHRHRIRDNEPYDQQVVSYTRRKRLA